MDPRTLNDLLFPRLVAAAAERAQTERGRERLETAAELSSAAEADAELTQVDEAVALLALPEHPSLDGVEDATPAIRAAAKGGVLGAPDLIACARMFRRGHDALRLLADLRLRAPTLADTFADVRDLGAIADRIAGTFDDDGRIRDDASPRLGELRARAVQLGRRVKERIEGMLRDVQVQDVLQDVYYTLREGRYVLPVKSEDHRFVPGIIHGISQTGATFFVEPVAIVEDNNQLKVVLDQTEVEELAILTDRSGLVGRYATDGLALAEVLWRLDSVLARARLARDLGGTRPTLATGDQALSLNEARNPVLLLIGRRVVAIAPGLPRGGQGAGMIVSGPNAGGKSVTLSTVGLCCAMVRFGYLPPVGPGSVVPWYRNIMTVVGDPTSMDRAVSTFTGQLARVREVFDRPAGRTLVLLDELATGTEPRRGEALAVAITRALVESGAECLVTTHYDALKRLADDDDRFLNARVGLDGTSGLPDYRLETGRAGESNPFEIAASVGFPTAVLKAARALVDEREARLDELLAETERLRAALSRETAEAEDLKRRVTEDKKRYERELTRLRSESDRLVYDARREVLQKMKQVEEELDKIAREARAEQSAAKLIVRRTEVRDKRAEVRRDMDREAPLVEKGVSAEPLPAADLKPGALVYVFNLRAQGKVVEVAADGRRAVVQVGLMKTNVKLADLRKPMAVNAPKPKPALPKYSTKELPPKDDGDQPFVRTERNSVDVRGNRVDEAIAAVDKKLDEAFMNEEEVVLIVHGMGTSALRKAVREYLKKSRYAKSHRAGGPQEGGDGVTVVKL